jgi:hypothetical protein
VAVLNFAYFSFQGTGGGEGGASYNENKKRMISFNYSCYIMNPYFVSSFPYTIINHFGDISIYVLCTGNYYVGKFKMKVGTF